jgi:hypothetical protein
MPVWFVGATHRGCPILQMQNSSEEAVQKYRFQCLSLQKMCRPGGLQIIYYLESFRTTLFVIKKQCKVD